MTINDNDKAVAAVAAPAVSSKKSYKRREAIWDTKFSFTDQNMTLCTKAWLKNCLEKRRKLKKKTNLKSFGGPTI